MSTWDEYKDHVKAVAGNTGQDVSEAEQVATIVTAMVRQRNALGLSQRDLAAIVRHSSVLCCPYLIL